ncbi:DUF1634 domain-containing protein [Saccharopolyspora sp. HNM0983]|uniref:DUF1634 domain-containing protein n=1 Tax=Saccharopolyspora montiporae TaxID=2781240 RepID=A0A929BEJ2_9PSEU|nr:DUF1634 domain-containing protein [Saccharopolyspora sp. HNM0983]MBE9376558.1 DUF1634 domain-containing protein [Saccharopolyspora sp. HNM0983]
MTPKDLSSTQANNLVVARSLRAVLYPALALIACGLIFALVEGEPLDAGAVELSQIVALDSTGTLLVALGVLVLACAPVVAVLAVLPRLVRTGHWTPARDAIIVLLLLTLAATI